MMSEKALVMRVYPLTSDPFSELRPQNLVLTLMGGGIGPGSAAATTSLTRCSYR
jgi:hypothetical protein